MTEARLAEPIDGDAIANAGPNAGTSATLLLYDWFKHITTLSLVTLGGVLSLLQGEANVRPLDLTVIIVMVAVAGILGFDGQNRIIKARLADNPLPRALDYIRPAAVASYSIGVGVFLAMFLERAQ